MDYEALGRHTAAIEAAQRAADAFSARLRTLTDDLRRIGSGPVAAAHHVPPFDGAGLRAQLEEITRLHAEMIDAAREANLQAPRCGRALITTGRGAARAPLE